MTWCTGSGWFCLTGRGHTSSLAALHRWCKIPYICVILLCSTGLKLWVRFYTNNSSNPFQLKPNNWGDIFGAQRKNRFWLVFKQNVGNLKTHAFLLNVGSKVVLHHWKSYIRTTCVLRTVTWLIVRRSNRHTCSLGAILHARKTLPSNSVWHKLAVECCREVFCIDSQNNVQKQGV